MLLAALLAAATVTAAPVRPARPPDGAYTYAYTLIAWLAAVARAPLPTKAIPHAPQIGQRQLHGI